MPRAINLDGVQHSFPDDASDDEIRAVLGGVVLPAKASQSDVRASDNAIAERLGYASMLKQKQLGSKDKALAMHVFTSPQEDLQNERNDLTLSNFDELEKEIKRTKDAKVKAILQEEHGRMKDSYANILGVK